MVGSFSTCLDRSHKFGGRGTRVSDTVDTLWDSLVESLDLLELRSPFQNELTPRGVRDEFITETCDSIPGKGLEGFKPYSLSLVKPHEPQILPNKAVEGNPR